MFISLFFNKIMENYFLLLNEIIRNAINNIIKLCLFIIWINKFKKPFTCRRTSTQHTYICTYICSSWPGFCFKLKANNKWLINNTFLPIHGKSTTPFIETFLLTELFFFFFYIFKSTNNFISKNFTLKFIFCCFHVFFFFLIKLFKRFENTL